MTRALTSLAMLLPMATPEELAATIRRTCTIKEAMQLAQVSRRTIYNWMAREKVQYVRTAGGDVRIVRASLFRAA